MRKNAIDIFIDILIGAVAAIFVFTMIMLIYTYASSYTISETIEVTVEDKKIDEDEYVTYMYINKMMYPQYHTDTDYYLYWEDGYVEVSQTIYNSVSIGDKIILNKVTRIKNNSDNIISIDYTYVGD